MIKCCFKTAMNNIGFLRTFCIYFVLYRIKLNMKKSCLQVHVRYIGHTSGDVVDKRRFDLPFVELLKGEGVGRSNFTRSKVLITLDQIFGHFSLDRKF